MAKLVGRFAAAGAGGADQPPRRPHTLVISVAHGDLRQARFPLAIGHYQGDSIVHAEERLDRQLGGRLTELFNLYLYPGPVGTAEVIHAPNASPPGALVIGLGNVGEIKPSVVRDGVSNAALRHALALLNESRNQPRAAAAADGDGANTQTFISAGLSALLLGTYGGNALSIGTSLSTIVQGVVQANEALRSQRLWDKVRISEVEVVELYEDVALEAIRAAVYLAEHPPSYLVKGDALQVEPLHARQLGNGRTQRPINPYAGGWWRRIQVTAEKIRGGGGQGGAQDSGKDEEVEKGLRFVALTDRARAEDTLQYTQPKLIEKAVKDAVDSTADAETLTTMLFKLLFPNALKEQAISDTDLVLVLDEETAQYPWELLAERRRGEIEPLAVRMGLLRQFKTDRFVANPQPARQRNALVVGAPKTTGQVALKAALEEAAEVAEILGKNGYDVGGGALNDAGPLQIMGRLFAKDYKIIHLAGHGKFTPGQPAKSGMILDEGILLTSMELANLNPLPELVFINCCYLGQMGDGSERLVTNSPHALAASVSLQLIESGVKAVVAAGWPVYDEPAKVFANTFYQELLRGQRFGDAFRTARASAFKLYRERNTWGAYQCYGNPDFVLERTGDGSESAEVDTRCYSRREYLERLGDLRSDAARADDKGRAALRAQLEEIDRLLPEKWRDGAVLCAMGSAWAEVGNFDAAIDYYRKAAEDEKGEAPFSTVEQLANMLSRHAESLRAQERSAGGSNGSAAPSPNKLMKEAFERLNWIFTLGETAERLSLMGSYFKRKAAVTPREKTAERTKYLRQGAAYYRKAYLLKRKKLKVVDPYPTLNWLTLRFLSGSPAEGGARLVEECKRSARSAESREPSFWNRATEADAELLQRLMAGDLEESLESVKALYQRAVNTGATPRQVSSMVEHMAFIAEMLSGSRGKSLSAEKDIRALEALRTHVASTGG